MAANTTIQLKKSSIPSSIPSNLANGEIAINYADGKLYYKNVAGYVVEFSPQTSANYFGTVNANGTLVVADTSGDVFSLIPGNNIQIVGDAINDTITISASVAGGGDPAPAFEQANTARVHANAAYEQANASYDYANIVYAQANAAYDAANNAVTDFSPAFEQANTARVHANSAYSQANAAYDQANSVNSRANVIGAASNNWANTVAGYANGYAETVGTAGNNYTIEVGAASNNWTNTQIGIVFAQANAAFEAANTEPDFGVANAAFAQANTAYDKANTANITADFAYDKANSANLLAYNSAIGANAYADAVGTAANTGTGAGANAYTVTVGTAANTYLSGWANNKFIANNVSNTAVFTGDALIDGNLAFNSVFSSRVWESAANVLSFYTTQTERLKLEANGAITALGDINML